MRSPARILALIAMLIVFGAAFPALRAADPEDARPAGQDLEKRKGEGEKRREGLKAMTPEERAAKRKEIKERLEKRIADLRSKQTNATLTAQESRELERREQILKRFEQDSVPRPDRPKVVPTNSPAENL